MAWSNDGNNKAPVPGQCVSVADGGRLYLNTLAGKAYVARETSNIFNPAEKPTDSYTAVPPWLFTHFGPEATYSKDWVFPSNFGFTDGKSSSPSVLALPTRWLAAIEQIRVWCSSTETCRYRPSKQWRQCQPLLGSARLKCQKGINGIRGPERCCYSCWADHSARHRPKGNHGRV